MKRKGLAIAGLVAGLSVLTSMTAFAGQWIYDANGEWQYIDHTIGWNQDSTGWWYQKADGSYPAATWQWIDDDKNNTEDGEQASYYFDANGYLVTNTTIDGYTVNADGAWTVDGVVQVQLTEWKKAEIERNKENENRTQRRYYDGRFNVYLDDPEYKTMREEMFADLNDVISRDRLDPKGEIVEHRTCSLHSKSIVYSDSERDHYWDIEREIAWEIVDYLYDTYGWELESFTTTGIMASSTIGSGSWNPLLEIVIKPQ